MRLLGLLIVHQSVFRGFRLRNRIHRVVSKLQTAAILQIQSLIRGIQARERVCILRFEQTSERRRRAGEPLQFTLPSRTRTVAAVSTLRVLYEHRKTRATLEFKTAKWREEQMYLRIHVRCAARVFWAMKQWRVSKRLCG